MEQARYWMWPKRKLEHHHYRHHHHHLLAYSTTKNPFSSSPDSWEEQAFAEDASGALGGCIWPPRSYTCSFCRREFRSAQALGGHMNVHRRDRARLKQSSPLSNSEDNNNNHDSRVLNQGQDGGGILKYDLRSNSDNWIRVSPNIHQEQKNKSNAADFCLIPEVKKNDLITLLGLKNSSDAIVVEEGENNLKIVDGDKKEGFVCVPTCDEVEQGSRCKRRRIENNNAANPVFGSFSKSGFDILSYPGEELDLELRLGEAPKVK